MFNNYYSFADSVLCYVSYVMLIIDISHSISVVCKVFSPTNALLLI
jgi:hypothetical protein